MFDEFSSDDEDYDPYIFKSWDRTIIIIIMIMIKD